MPTNFVLKTMNAVHQGVLRLSGGRLGGKLANMPVVELTTTGRKTGQPRTVLLTSPLQDGTKFLVVASRGGDPAHPAWYGNLVANPEVTLQTPGSPAKRAIASVVPDQERAELWAKVTTAYRGYAGYQEKTTRQIPLVWITPTS